MAPPSSAGPVGQSLSAAVKQFIGANAGKKIEDETIVKLICTSPPIDKIDNAVNAFVNCVHLSLSTNCIDKIPLLPKSGLPRLEILSLGRNMIKKISGLEEVGATLRELWISYNQISTLDGLNCCTKLETLFISNNKLKDMSEIKRLSLNPQMANINLVGNPIYENVNKPEIRLAIIKTLPSLRVLDGELITETERSSTASSSGRRQPE
jgi:dynein light chain 1